MLIFNASPIEAAPSNPIPLTVHSLIQCHLHPRNKLLQNKRHNTLQSSITTEINSVQWCVTLQCSTHKDSSSVSNLIACFKHKKEFISSFVLFFHAVFHAVLLDKFSLVKVGWFFNISLNTMVPSPPILFSALIKKRNVFCCYMRQKKNYSVTSQIQVCQCRTTVQCFTKQSCAIFSNIASCSTPALFWKRLSIDCHPVNSYLTNLSLSMAQWKPHHWASQTNHLRNLFVYRKLLIMHTCLLSFFISQTKTPLERALPSSRSHIPH